MHTHFTIDKGVHLHVHNDVPVINSIAGILDTGGKNTLLALQMYSPESILVAVLMVRILVTDLSPGMLVMIDERLVCTNLYVIHIIYR